MLDLTVRRTDDITQRLGRIALCIHEYPGKR